VTTAVLVPIKGFGAAKARLDGVLAEPERAELARTLAAKVLAAASPLPALVVCDDDEVAAFATAQGAGVLRQGAPGLNAAATEGVEHLAERGVDRVVVAHADIARANGLVELALLAEGAVDGTVVIVPDRHGDGTNVLVVPVGRGFTFAYGPGSFARHRSEAERLDLPVVVVHDPDLGWDVDTPDDLAGL
jgi:2-phospho-L-lactate guanylyltransferase